MPLKWLIPGLVLVGMAISGVGINAYLDGKTKKFVYSKDEQRLQSMADSLLFSLEAMRGDFSSPKNRKIMQRILENVAAIPEVTDVYLVKPDMEVLLDPSRKFIGRPAPQELSSFIRDSFQSAAPSEVITTIQKIRSMIVVRPIKGGQYDPIHQTSFFGALVFVYNLEIEDRLLQKHATTAILIQLASIILIAFLVYLVLIQRIVSPLRGLRETVKNVGQSDFSRRAKIFFHDELGEATNALNSMLNEIQIRDSELEKHRTHLEELVHKRTQDLENSNRQLKVEVLEREKAQTQLLQAGKMAAIGQLAGGVAHEINNPLGVILGFAQGLDKRVPEGDPLRLPVASILRESLRCKALVQELLTFSRTAKTTSEPIDLNDLIKASGILLETRAKTQDVQVAYDLPDNIPKCQANKTQLQQIFVNLGTNSMDAMANGGTLTFSTRYNGNGKVQIEVSDNGPGIPEEFRARIFEPFFTTKDVGKGTGLGLSLVYEIVQQHNGTIDVQSKVGDGTTMMVTLPTTSLPGKAAA